MNINPLNCIDFYKADHRRQYPKGTEMVYSNLTPRSTKLAPKYGDDKIVFFGLQYFMQYFLIEVWNKNFFDQPKKIVVEAYKQRMDKSLGKDAIPVDHIEALHDLQCLPICIMALPEGSVVNAKVPMLTIYNTHPDFFWLVNYFESILSNMLWKPCTSATTARKYKQILLKYSKLTCDNDDHIQFQAHDFSFRGMSGMQDAVLSGAGHLLSFVGTDTVAAIDFLEEYYHAGFDALVGCSVPATEHSVMCLGSEEGEIETFERLITEIYPKGIVSIVSDTWDFWQVIGKYLPLLKDKIMARDGKVVIRPDSGDPVLIVCGDMNSSDRLICNGAIQSLWETFGGTINEKGYKVLDPHIGLIYGDSITLERAYAILETLKEMGFAASNVVFGVGSFTYEYCTRDTYGFAMKATAGIINGEFKEIYKTPKTDDGTKKSAKGYIAVHKDEKGDFYLKDQVSKVEMENCELGIAFYEGEICTGTNLKTIRNRLNEKL